MALAETRFRSFTFDKMKGERSPVFLLLYRRISVAGRTSLIDLLGHRDRLPYSLHSTFFLAVEGNDCQSSIPSGSSFRTLFSTEGGGKQEGNFPHFPKRKRFFPNPKAREWTRSNCPGNQNLHSVIRREKKKTSEEQELNGDSVTKSNIKTNSPIQRFLCHTYSRWTPFITDVW
jgi:hypothetical protein